jgi:hypothetical protein
MNEYLKHALLPAMLAGILALLFAVHLVANSAEIVIPAGSNDSRKKNLGMGGEQQNLPKKTYAEECGLPPRLPQSVLDWCAMIETEAGTHGVDPLLIASVILVESAGNPYAVSHSGAVGLMQVMPRDGLAAGFICVNGPCFHDRPSMNELMDPEFNIAYGSQMVAKLARENNSLQEALRAYGPLDVGYSYADQVLWTYQSYR